MKDGGRNQTAADAAGRTAAPADAPSSVDQPKADLISPPPAPTGDEAASPELVTAPGSPIDPLQPGKDDGRHKAAAAGRTAAPVGAPSGVDQPNADLTSPPPQTGHKAASLATAPGAPIDPLQPGEEDGRHQAAADAAAGRTAAPVGAPSSIDRPKADLTSPPPQTGHKAASPATAPGSPIDPLQPGKDDGRHQAAADAAGRTAAGAPSGVDQPKADLTSPPPRTRHKAASLGTAGGAPVDSLQPGKDDKRNQSAADAAADPPSNVDQLKADLISPSPRTGFTAASPELVTASGSLPIDPSRPGEDDGRNHVAANAAGRTAAPAGAPSSVDQPKADLTSPPPRTGHKAASPELVTATELSIDSSQWGKNVRRNQTADNAAGRTAAPADAPSSVDQPKADLTTPPTQTGHKAASPELVTAPESSIDPWQPCKDDRRHQTAADAAGRTAAPADAPSSVDQPKADIISPAPQPTGDEDASPELATATGSPIDPLQPGQDERRSQAADDAVGRTAAAADAPSSTDRPKAVHHSPPPRPGYEGVDFTIAIQSQPAEGRRRSRSTDDALAELKKLVRPVENLIETTPAAGAASASTLDRPNPDNVDRQAQPTDGAITKDVAFPELSLPGTGERIITSPSTTADPPTLSTEMASEKPPMPNGAAPIIDGPKPDDVRRKIRPARALSALHPQWRRVQNRPRRNFPKRRP